MEQYTTNGQIITNLTTTTEGNALIMRKGRTSLLSAKVMLFALLKVENRNDKQYNIKERQYYQKLLLDTTVDYGKGLVAEMDVTDLRKLLKKERSGSFYTSLKELFSTDPHEEKSLRNSWAVMLPNTNSGILGYAEVVAACHYDVANGKLFMKFSDEEFIKSQIWQIKSEYTELPFLHMISIKSIYTYRLYEILYSEVTKSDIAMEEGGGVSRHSEYSFRFALGELQLMLGILDITIDKVGKKKISSKDPDYNYIAADVNSRQRENMGEYRSFRRYSLDVAMTEINETETSAFTLDYDVEREEGSRKVAYVIFYVKRKSATPSIEASTNNVKASANFVVDIARDLSEFSLTYDDLNRIAVAANYDKNLITTAQDLYVKLKVTDNFADWFVELRR
jgi:hypothetical protein